ncbi:MULTISPECIES: flavin reductase [unclassified Helicobacter]|uniref:flavin reductase n=1 Tax=unclassified Helicobacter TaxID=2593540 RepID=UPI000CF034BF|nr:MULTISPECIES: flavin reductase [unclassified Helicobacter]
MQIDLATSSLLTKYKILSNSVTPRPIAWIVTVNNNGVVNMAPFSFFAPISTDPVAFSICFSLKSNGDLKDTFKNILEERRATICMCDMKNLKSMHLTSQEIDSQTSEALVFDIKLKVINPLYPPIPEHTKGAFLCDFLDILKIGKSSKTVLMEAKEFFIDDEFYNPNLDFRFDNVGRVGKEYQITTKAIKPTELI